MRQFHFDFTVFFRFLGSDFFLRGFYNPFLVHSGPSFLFEPNLFFSLVVFFCACGILTLIFCFFQVFYLISLEMVFPIGSWFLFPNSLFG